VVVSGYGRLCVFIDIGSGEVDAAGVGRCRDSCESDEVDRVSLNRSRLARLIYANTSLGDALMPLAHAATSLKVGFGLARYKASRTAILSAERPGMDSEDSVN
jgi:hypothetical protein